MLCCAVLCMSHLQSSVTGTRHPDSKQPARDDTVTVTWAARSSRTATGPPLFRDWPGSVGRSNGRESVRLQFRFRSQLWRPSPSSTYYFIFILFIYLLLLLPCFSNPSRLSPNFLPMLKKKLEFKIIIFTI